MIGRRDGRTPADQLGDRRGPPRDVGGARPRLDAEPATTPHTITTFDGRIAIYIAAAHAYRYYWDPQTSKLSQDHDWTIPYLAEGQKTGDAPGMMGEWIAIQTNGLVSPVPSSVVAISQRDPDRVTTIQPFGPLGPGQMSFAPPKTGTDPGNHMLYSADLGVGKVAGIRLDPSSGEMTVQFLIDDSTAAFQPLIGDQDERVLILSDMQPDDPGKAGLAMLMSGSYHERVRRPLAASSRHPIPSNR